VYQWQKFKPKLGVISILFPILIFLRRTFILLANAIYRRDG